MFYQMLFNLPTCWWERTYYHHPYSNFIPARKDLSPIPTEQLGNLSRALVVREEPRICTILTVKNVFSTIPGFCHWSPFGRQPCDGFLALWPHLYSCLPSLVAKNTSAKEFIGHRTEFLCAKSKWATPETWECPALRKHPSLMGPAQVWQAYTRHAIQRTHSPWSPQNRGEGPTAIPRFPVKHSAAQTRPMTLSQVSLAPRWILMLSECIRRANTP